MQSLIRRIYRERRRMAIFATMAALSGYIFFIGDSRTLHGLPISTVASLGFAGCLTLMGLIVCVMMPAYRFVLEALGLMLLVYAVLSIYIPALNVDSAAIPIVNVILFMGGAQLLHHLFYGPWSDKYLNQAVHIDRATTLTDMDQEDLWLSLYPDPHTREYYYDDTLIEMERAEGRPDALHVVNSRGNGMFVEQIVHFDQIKRGWSFRTVYEVLGRERGKSGKLPVYTLVFEPRDNDLAVHIRWERYDFPTRRAMMHWIDDWAGRKLDEMVRKSEAKMAQINQAMGYGQEA